MPAGHDSIISATIGDVTGEDEQNDDEHQQRLREDAAPRARRTPELSDDETRKRRRGPTQDRGRRSFGAVAVGDVGVSLRSARGGSGGRVLTAAEVSRRRLVRAVFILHRSATTASVGHTAAGQRPARRSRLVASGSAGFTSWAHWGCFHKARVEPARSGRSERSVSAPAPMRRRRRVLLRAEQGGRRRSLSVP